MPESVKNDIAIYFDRMRSQHRMRTCNSIPPMSGSSTDCSSHQAAAAAAAAAVEQLGDAIIRSIAPHPRRQMCR